MIYNNDIFAIHNQRVANLKLEDFIIEQWRFHRKEIELLESEIYEQKTRISDYVFEFNSVVREEEISFLRELENKLAIITHTKEVLQHMVEKYNLLEVSYE